MGGEEANLVEDDQRAVDAADGVVDAPRVGDVAAVCHREGGRAAEVKSVFRLAGSGIAFAGLSAGWDGRGRERLALG